MADKRPRTMISLILLGAVAISNAADARPALNPEEEARIGQCIRTAASGRTWLERTLWGLRDQEAGWVGAEVPNTNGTHDFGPMQINSWWLPKLSAMTGHSPEKVRSWLIHDACFNVQVARWIFLSELNTTGAYWLAIGGYHSPNAYHARRYAASVARKVDARFNSLN